jgi:HK97 family phage major capsid protein
METAILDAIKTEIAGIKAFTQTHLDAGIAPLTEETDRLGVLVLQLQARLQDAQRADLAAPFGATPRVRDGAYAGMDRLDLAIANSILTAQQDNPTGLSPATRGALDEWRINIAAAMDSVTAGSGDELVPTNESSELWRDVNLATKIMSLIRTISMPTNPFELPVDLGDINFYPGTENVAAKSTSPTTAKKTLTAYELVGEVPWSYDLDEDSVISMMEEVRALVLRNAAEIIDDVILNGDTTAANNINADGATITTSDAGKAHWLLGFDGMRHLPLISATGQANNHNAAVSDDMFNENRRNMGKYAVNPSECVHVMDISTWLISQTIENMRTLDKFGPKATILNGQLGAHEGIPVIVSEQLLKTASDGKVTDGSAGTVGQLLTFNRSQWIVGFKRQITLETVRDPQKRQNIIVVSFRIALQQREPTIADATHIALQYNITGV